MIDMDTTPDIAVFAEMLREILSADPDMPSYRNTLDRAETLVQQAIAAGIIHDDPE